MTLGGRFRSALGVSPLDRNLHAHPRPRPFARRSRVAGRQYPGSVCRHHRRQPAAEPHSDPATLLVAWDAIFTLRSGRRSRTVAASDFFVGLLETAREDDELLTGIDIPVLPPNAGSAYARFKTHERPSATVAVVLWISGGEIADARLVAGRCRQPARAAHGCRRSACRQSPDARSLRVGCGGGHGPGFYRRGRIRIDRLQAPSDTSIDLEGVAQVAERAA